MCPQVPWFTFLFGAMFAMHSHLFGEIYGLESRSAAPGRRTLAGVPQAKPAKWLFDSRFLRLKPC